MLERESEIWSAKIRARSTYIVNVGTHMVKGYVGTHMVKQWVLWLGK